MTTDTKQAILKNLETKFGYIFVNRFCFFQRGPFSNWYGIYKNQISEFQEDGNFFNCTEQYMMYRKAIQFGDLESAKKILATPNPQEQKDLGRQVAGFNNEKWREVREPIVTQGLRLKFTEPKNLFSRQALEASAGYTIVENAPWDAIWGTGVEMDDEVEEGIFPGLNLLGKCLMSVRDELLK